MSSVPGREMNPEKTHTSPGGVSAGMVVMNSVLSCEAKLTGFSELTPHSAIYEAASQ